MTKKGDGKYLPKPRRGPLGRASLRSREQAQAKPAPVQFFWVLTTQKGYLKRYPFCVVGTVRLELMTSCMSSMRSNQLSYAPAYSMRHRFRKFSLIIIPFFKADCQSKTPHFLTFLCSPFVLYLYQIFRLEIDTSFFYFRRRHYAKEKGNER